ncbi:MAG: hypothetical protein AAFV88_22825 [Planctomycetota bacterium]
MILTFDTRQVYRSLSREGNFTSEQAETLTDALRDVASHNIDHLASKQDLAVLRQELEAAEDRALSKIDALNEKFEVRFDRVDDRMESMTERFESRLRELEHQLTIRLGGMMVVGLGVIVALQQLLGG